MKISNLQGVTFVNAVNNMKGKRLPVRVSFALKLNCDRLLNGAIKAYEAARLELIDQYKDLIGKEDQFKTELENLLAEETEIDIKQIGIAELEKIDQSDVYDKLTMVEIDAISCMICEEAP